jgi:hypothetical protein
VYAFSGERFGDRAANAFAGPGNDGRLVLEFNHGHG